MTRPAPAARPIRPRLALREQQTPSPHLPEIARRLQERYLPTVPSPHLSREPLDGLIKTILSQQNVGPITQRQFDGLKRAFPTWEAALLEGPDGIEAALRAAGGGLARTKADYIWNVLHTLQERESGKGQLSLRETRSMDDAEVRGLLESLPGVGPKTASCVLLFDLARPAMPVDTHIDRISKRLELVPERWNAVKVERWYEEVLPREWRARYAFHVSMIRHGRETCRARGPRCDVCVLRDLCPSEPLLRSPARRE